MRLLLAALLACPFAFAGCTAPSQTDRTAAGEPVSTGSSPADARTTAGLPSGEWFVDRAHEAGIDFVHDNGMTGHFYQPEIMAPGAALFDYDNDGDLDVYLVQSGRLGEGAPLIPWSGPPGDRLYRNDLRRDADGTTHLRFTDVTAASGLAPGGYGMGVAVGDIDNDGWPDLYRTGFGESHLLHNNGNGTFTDITAASGTANAGLWSVSAAFVDIDRDGLLDLFVANYLNYTLQSHVPCFGPSGAPDYCRPGVYRAQPNRLYRNLGGGRFRDVTIEAGVAREFGPALGVIGADLNGDGWQDLFVTNDEQENQLWINQRDGTFVNTALAAGAALGPSGERKANMGVDAGDFDADGDEDLFVTELVSQGSSLWVNDGTATFEERSAPLGIRGPSLPFTGFGAAWFDFDNDGWLDLLAVNGEVNQNPAMLARHPGPFPLGQRKQLFHNAGGRFDDVSAQAGRVFELEEAGRGAAFGDVDNDGDTDVLVANGAGPARLLINQIGSRQHWIGLRLVSPDLKRDMVGARVVVSRDNGPAILRHARADGSYGSANDPRVLVGLGSSAATPRVEVVWPDGHRETFANVAIDRYTTLAEGSGR